MSIYWIEWMGLLMAMQTSYQQVLQVVRQWLPAQRYQLVFDVLVTLRSENRERRPHHTLEKAIGLLATGQSAPSDAEIEDWLSQRRQEKFG